MASSFVSCFKINGVPILPPLITPEICAEILSYKKKAIFIEQKRKEVDQGKLTVANCVESETEYTLDNAAMQTLTKKYNSEKEPSNLEILNLENLPDSTLTTVKNDSFNMDTGGESVTPRLIRSNSYTLDNPSPLLIQHLHNENLNITSSTSMNEISLERKKSKKLDFNDGVTPLQKKSPRSAQKPEWVSSRKVSLKSLKPIKKQKSPYEPISKSNVKSAGKSKMMIVEKKSSAPREILSLKENITLGPTAGQYHKRIEEIKADHEMKMMELLKKQEQEQHRLLENFRQQQEELMKLLPVPVLDEIHTSTPLVTSPNESTVDGEILPSFRKLNISTKEFAPNNESQFSIDNLSSSQTIVLSNTSDTSAEFENSDDLYKTCDNSNKNNKSSDDMNGNIQINDIRNYIHEIGGKIDDTDLKELSGFGGSREELKKQAGVQQHAASIINAYARGYLTRRLFQTDRVQKIVQIIRDTLLFILDLHYEKTAREQFSSPADLQLKRNLLHQLTSACYQLHEIFFETNIPQRMEIIRRDREHIRRKLENRPRTASYEDSSRSYMSSSADASHINQNFRKLRLCSLYSVNIAGTPSDKTDDTERQLELINSEPINSNPISKSDTSTQSILSGHLFDATSPLVSPSFSVTGVPRFVNQKKKATSPIVAVRHSQNKVNQRPKTSEAAFHGATYCRPSKEQKYI